MKMELKQTILTILLVLVPANGCVSRNCPADSTVAGSGSTERQLVFAYDLEMDACKCTYGIRLFDSSLSHQKEVMKAIVESLNDNPQFAERVFQSANKKFNFTTEYEGEKSVFLNFHVPGGDTNQKVGEIALGSITISGEKHNVYYADDVVSKLNPGNCVDQSSFGLISYYVEADGVTEYLVFTARYSETVCADEGDERWAIAGPYEPRDQNNLFWIVLKKETDWLPFHALEGGLEDVCSKILEKDEGILKQLHR